MISAKYDSGPNLPSKLSVPIFESGDLRGRIDSVMGGSNPAG